MVLMSETNTFYPRPATLRVPSDKVLTGDEPALFVLTLESAAAGLPTRWYSPNCYRGSFCGTPDRVTGWPSSNQYQTEIYTRQSGPSIRKGEAHFRRSLDKLPASGRRHRLAGVTSNSTKRSMP